jgi:hypothetical protein
MARVVPIKEANLRTDACKVFAPNGNTITRLLDVRVPVDTDNVWKISSAFLCCGPVAKNKLTSTSVILAEAEYDMDTSVFLSNEVMMVGGDGMPTGEIIELDTFIYG